MEVLFIIGRILFGGFFLMNGINHFMKLGMMSGYAKSKGVPAAKLAVVLSGIMLILGSLGILFWIYLDIAIILLVIFLFFISFWMHNFWAIADPQQKMAEMVNFTKNMALIGALLIILVTTVL